MFNLASHYVYIIQYIGILSTLKNHRKTTQNIGYFVAKIPHFFQGISLEY